MCHQAFEIDLQASEAHLLDEIVEADKTCSCPKNCGGRILMVDDDSDTLPRYPIHVTTKELYQALHGAGLPDEIPNDLNVIAALLKANTVTNLSIENFNNRLYLHEIELSDGSTIHLAAGAKGALVMKITKRTP
jgi:hypothetical protein